jgi:hypothetical protein
MIREFGYRSLRSARVGGERVARLHAKQKADQDTRKGTTISYRLQPDALQALRGLIEEPYAFVERIEAYWDVWREDPATQVEQASTATFIVVSR